MAYIIGITSKPEKRKLEWKKEYPNMIEWKILEIHKVKILAESARTRLVKFYGDEIAPKESEDEDGTIWSVYRFKP